MLGMQEAQELGSALGYLLLYLELAASYLGTPLLNQVLLTVNQHMVLVLSRIRHPHPASRGSCVSF